MAEAKTTAQPRAAISVITWIEALVGCQGGKAERVEPWLASFECLSLDHAIAQTTLNGLSLATRNSRDFPLKLGCVVHPYQL